MSFLDPRAVRDWCKQSFLMKDNVLKTVETVKENTKEGKSVDALVIKEVFQSVSDGKALLASVITDKGVYTDAEATFSTMAENVGKIESGNVGNGSLKVQRIPISISAYYSLKTIDIKEYTENYQNLKLYENLFAIQTENYFKASQGFSAGWQSANKALYSYIGYEANNGYFKIRSADYSGYSGYLYIVEAE